MYALTTNIKNWPTQGLSGSFTCSDFSVLARRLKGGCGCGEREEMPQYKNHKPLYIAKLHVHNI